MQDSLLGDVLDRLHHAGEKLSVGRLAGRERDAAVAEQGCRDAVPRHGRDLRVPTDLGIEVCMQVDETGRHDQSVGLNFFLASAVDLADLDDLIAVHGDVRTEGLASCAVDYVAAPND